MFSFFQTIFHGVKVVIATAAIAIGLISAPVPQTPAVVNTNNTFTIDHQKAEISKTIQQAQPTEKVKTIIKTVDNFAELEKSKQEAETQRIAKEQAESKLKEIQDQQAAQTATRAQAQTDNSEIIPPSQSPPSDITDQVGSYISNKYSEFKEWVNRYDNCIAKYDQIIRPLKDKLSPFKEEENNMINEWTKNPYLLTNQDFSQKFKDISSKTLNMEQEIDNQMWLKNQECTPYANMALGKAPYEGVSANFPQALQQLTPQQSYNYLECTTEPLSRTIWVTRCSDNTTCQTYCSSTSCTTTCN